jgi:hypothetical protein
MSPRHRHHLGSEHRESGISNFQVKAMVADDVTRQILASYEAGEMIVTCGRNQSRARQRWTRSSSDLRAIGQAAGVFRRAAKGPRFVFDRGGGKTVKFGRPGSR